MSAAPSFSVDLDIPAGTPRATLAHGCVYFAWRRRGSRFWDTDRKSLDEAQAFIGPLADAVVTARRAAQATEH
ncbi:hypothetical protein [Methylobacterium brachiatum]